MGRRKYVTTVRRKRGKSDQHKKGVFLVERRKHPRIRVELPLDYALVESEENHGGIAANIGEGGILAYLPEAVKIGALLKIEILFVKGSELTSIKGIAKVVWFDLAPRKIWGEYRCGLQFQSFQEGNLHGLKSLLQEVGETYDENEVANEAKNSS